MPTGDLLLIGAGPVGCLLASALASRGQACDWYIRNPQLRIQLHGLRLRFPDSEIQPDLSSVNFPEQLDTQKYNAVITCVKSQQTEPLLSSLDMPADTRILAVANGLISGSFQLGLLYGGAYLDDEVLHTRHSNLLQIGTLGAAAEHSDWFAELLRCDWLFCEGVPDMEIRQWHKLCLNCVLNPLTALLDVPNGSMLASLDSPLVSGLIRELQLVASQHLGSRWNYSAENIREGVRLLIEATIANSSSMREDLRRGREPEIANMNAAIVRLGDQHGIPCPLHAAVTEMINSVSEVSAEEH
ncbi:MAG: ketopantoate reductase C-terminal domain-containing protein [bacterium]